MNFLPPSATMIFWSSGVTELSQKGVCTPGVIGFAKMFDMDLSLDLLVLV